MSGDRPSNHDLLASLLARLDARAAGWWRIGDGVLVQVAFAASEELAEEVAQSFAAATLSVSLDETGLGIVHAALSGEPAVSRADDLPSDTGSGLWLRRFGAVRSVAVPVLDGSGRVVRVVSVALAEGPPDDVAVAGWIQETAEEWTE